MLRLIPDPLNLRTEGIIQDYKQTYTGQIAGLKYEAHDFLYSIGKTSQIFGKFYFETPYVKQDTIEKIEAEFSAKISAKFHIKWNARLHLIQDWHNDQPWTAYYLDAQPDEDFESNLWTS